MIQEESTTVAIAERVREALEGADLSAIAELLDPAARGGAPDDAEGGCQNRTQVLDWYRRGREAGARARVTEVVAKGDKILVGLKVTGTPAAEELGGEADRWQVLTVPGTVWWTSGHSMTVTRRRRAWVCPPDGLWATKPLLGHTFVHATDSRASRWARRTVSPLVAHSESMTCTSSWRTIFPSFRS